MIIIKTQTLQKLHFLDGMRALMAMNVILCHFVCVYYPQMYFEDFAAKGDALSVFATTPLSVLVNGSIAVVYFFALTGFLVGMSTFTRPSDIRSLEKKSVNRYIRLLPIVVIVTILTYLTMVFGLQKHLDITNTHVNTSFLSNHCNFTPSLPHLISHCFFRPFVNYSAYIGPFWTIHYELWGYILVLIAANILRESKFRRVFYILIAFLMVLFLDQIYAIFIMGLFVADLCFNREPTILSRSYENIFCKKPFIFICFLIGTYFSCCPMFDASPLYAIWFKLPIINNVFIRGIGITLFLFSAYHSSIIQKILSFKPLVKLGEMSFETYALHWPIMLTLEAWLFLSFENKMSYHAAALLSFVITLPIIYLLSIVLNHIVKRINPILSGQKKLLKKP